MVIVETVSLHTPGVKAFESKEEALKHSQRWLSRSNCVRVWKNAPCFIIHDFKGKMTALEWQYRSSCESRCTLSNGRWRCWRRLEWAAYLIARRMNPIYPMKPYEKTTELVAKMSPIVTIGTQDTKRVPGRHFALCNAWPARRIGRIWTRNFDLGKDDAFLQPWGPDWKKIFWTSRVVLLQWRLVSRWLGWRKFREELRLTNGRFQEPFTGTPTTWNTLLKRWSSIFLQKSEENYPMGKKLKVLQPQHLANTMKRANLAPVWIEIHSYSGNNKTEWNVLDTVKGCNMGCPDCYARTGIDVWCERLISSSRTTNTEQKTARWRFGQNQTSRWTNCSEWRSRHPAYDWDLVIKSPNSFTNRVSTTLSDEDARSTDSRSALQLSACAVMSIGFDWLQPFIWSRMAKEGSTDAYVSNVGGLRLCDPPCRDFRLWQMTLMSLNLQQNKAWADMGFKFMEYPGGLWRHTLVQRGPLDWSQYKQHIAYGSRKTGRKQNPEIIARTRRYSQTHKPMLGCNRLWRPNQWGTTGLWVPLPNGKKWRWTWDMVAK